MKLEVIGKLSSVMFNPLTKKNIISFETESISGLYGENLKDTLLSISISQLKHNRSLNANGMLWSCLGIMASHLGVDKWEVYLMMLKRYGKYTYICVKPNVVDAVKTQWRECEEIGEIEIKGQKAVQLLCYFGSSTYDTEEFSKLLNGVISEMKEMGLTPPPTAEMNRVLEEWDAKYHSKG